MLSGNTFWQRIAAHKLELLTCNKEGYPDTDDSYVPQTPEVRSIEQFSSISEFSDLLVCKSCDPYVEQNLGRCDMLETSLH